LAEYQGKAVSGMLIHIFKDGVLYWGGCSLFEALKLRPNNFLLWSVIKWAKNSGYKWFEVGQFQTYPWRNIKEYNIGRYKSQFGEDYLVPFEGVKYYTVKSEIVKCVKRIRNKLMSKKVK
jgi:lipid II:glycine glycyltransferase (peptidoglycan interpeptide bridge formation enzyme)